MLTESCAMFFFAVIWQRPPLTEGGLPVMSRVTSRSPEQFEWSTCGSSEAIVAFQERNVIETYFLIKKKRRKLRLYSVALTWLTKLFIILCKSHNSTGFEEGAQKDLKVRGSPWRPWNGVNQPAVMVTGAKRCQGTRAAIEMSMPLGNS